MSICGVKVNSKQNSPACVCVWGGGGGGRGVGVCLCVSDPTQVIVEK